MSDKKPKPGADEVRHMVRDAYSRIAHGAEKSCCGPAKSCCSGSAPKALAESLGYEAAELAALPDGANMGLSCGNPTAMASLKAGDIVLDLGSGGGFDVFIAARRVGPTGRVVGVDMTPAMIEKARANAVAFRAETGLDNVEFRLGEIEHLPVADASVDVIISNCVINLSPDKPQVWREMFRVLKPGGRVAVSDLALRRPLPEALRQSAEALVGCVAGAALIADIAAMVDAAGFVRRRMVEKPESIDRMTSWNDPLYRTILGQVPGGTKLSDYVVSLDVVAEKPA